MSGEDIKPGYKRTEVGVIPEDWCLKNVCELGAVITGGTPATDVREYWSGQYPWVTPTDINGERDMSKSHRMLTDAGLRSIRPLPPDTVLVTCIASIGKNAILRTLGGCNQQINALIPNEKHDVDYIYYMFEAAKKYLLANAGTTATSIVSKANFEDLEFPIPPLNEQREIANTLTSVDVLLAKFDQLITKKRDLKQATMQQLLTGQTRLPGFSGEWEVKRLGDIGDCLRGVTYKGDVDLSAHDTAYTKRLLRSNNVQNSTVVINDLQFVNAARVAEQQLLRKQDILICMANGSKALVGKAGFFDIDDSHEYTFGAFMGCFRTKIEVSNPDFVFYLFQTSRYKDYINNLLAGSSINNLNPGSIESLEFKVPKMEEQTAIASVLLDLDSELQCLEARREKTRVLKRGMMHELLTGCIRLI